jgi:hypothetical protein
MLSEGTVSVLRAAAILAAAALAAPLCACSEGLSGVKQSLGLTANPPDEFTVVARAPLSVPPDYTLRPPRAGALRPQDSTPTEQARATVFRSSVEKQAAPQVAPAGRSAGEVALLNQAGAGSADPNIRRIVNQENSKLLQADNGFVNSLLFWRKPDEPGTVVDPGKEAQRLHQNVADGKPATEGETPIIERKKKALLDGIF